MSTPPPLTVACPAKLNLALSVGAIASDDGDDAGLHPLCSWMAPIGLYDELTVTRLEDDRWSRYAILAHAEAPRPIEVDWPVQRDLAVRAHLAVEQHVDERLPIQMKLEKRIPPGSGLGGGSSNAAAMLLALNRLYELRLSKDELSRIGFGLGSDVPFFLYSGPAIVGGFGEMVEPIPAAFELHAVVVLPDVHCSTGDVYDSFDDLNDNAAVDNERVTSAATHESVFTISELLFNDLSAPACSVAPILATYQRQLTNIAERPAQISGSGSSMFILCDDAMHAAALQSTIETELELPAVAVAACETSHDPAAA